MKSEYQINNEHIMLRQKRTDKVWREKQKSKEREGNNNNNPNNSNA